MTHHANIDACPKCAEILDRYPGFDANLRAWFLGLRKRCPEAHVSCAGRGRIEQEACFARRVSRAHWGESAHNYNAALDLFVLVGGAVAWPIEWFVHNVGRTLVPGLKWYGEPGAAFFELPHVEVSDWRERRHQGTISLVE